EEEEDNEEEEDKEEQKEKQNDEKRQQTPIVSTKPLVHATKSGKSYREEDEEDVDIDDPEHIQKQEEEEEEKSIQQVQHSFSHVFVEQIYPFFFFFCLF
ncbi:hypothetical protein RFI_07559, partial [Reticulomyxa filosa]